MYKINTDKLPPTSILWVIWDFIILVKKVTTAGAAC